jgi:hypothetical protein
MIFRSKHPVPAEFHPSVMTEEPRSQRYGSGSNSGFHPAQLLGFDLSSGDKQSRSYPTWAKWFAGLFGFWCMTCYPALNMGANSALTGGNILTLLCVIPVLMTSWKNKPYYLLILLFIPQWISAGAFALFGRGDPTMCVKVNMSRTVSFSTLMVTQFLFPLFSLEILTGIAISAIMHFLIGMWQLHSFANHEFPMDFLYINNSFLSVQDMIKTIARYIQRPFGLFPEPSAMSSSLAPWVVLWIGEICGLVKFRRTPSTIQRILFSLGALGALLLIILSRSGHTAVTLLPILIFAVIWISKCRATPKNILILGITFGIVLPVIISMGMDTMNERLGGKSSVGNSSWEERSTSLVAGGQLVLHLGLYGIAFGVGPGMTSPLMYGLYQLEAVWSCILTYIYENGALGLVACIWIAVYIARLWKRDRFNIVLASIFFVWFIGVLLTTSYDHLLPIWLSLGMMTVWDKVAATPVAENSTLPSKTSLQNSPAQMQFRGSH